jgi:hypothetical protein
VTSVVELRQHYSARSLCPSWPLPSCSCKASQMPSPTFTLSLWALLLQFSTFPSPRNVESDTGEAWI